MTKIASTAIIHPGVELGQGTIVEDYCIIGAIPTTHSGPPLETRIGENSVIRSHTVIYAGNTIGTGFQTGNRVNIRESNVIGDNVSIGTGSIVEHHVSIGNGTRIHSQAFIPEYSEIESDVWIGPCVVLTNAVYPKSPQAKTTLKGPILRKNCMIGANTTILPGVEIGSNSLVGAGSLVSKDVPKEALSYGHPSAVKRSMKDLPYMLDDSR